MITEQDIFSAMLAGVELKLNIGAPTTDFGNDFRQKFDYKGPLSKKAMGPELWNEYNKMLYRRRKESKK